MFLTTKLCTYGVENTSDETQKSKIPITKRRAQHGDIREK